MKICLTCKKEYNDAKGKFCVFCGGKLIEKNHKIENENNEISNQNESKKQKSIINKHCNNILKIILIFLVIALVIVSGIAIYLKVNDNTSELENEISTLKKQISTLKEEKNKLSSENTSLKSADLKNSKKINFFDKNVVFVLDGYGSYYYTYDQMVQVTKGKSFEFWAYNIEQARDLGYKAWK